MSFLLSVLCKHACGVGAGVGCGGEGKESEERRGVVDAHECVSVQLFVC